MFENIGGKIKTLAKVCTWIGIISFAIIGVSQLIGGDVLSAIITIVIGCILSWVSSFLIYGFGELIEKVTDIERNTRNALLSGNKTAKEIVEREEAEKNNAHISSTFTTTGIMDIPKRSEK